MDELRAAIKTAKPGSIIEVAKGTYELQRDLELKRLVGTPKLPITIRAGFLLQTRFIGRHVVKVRDSRHLVLEGFRFAMDEAAGGKNGLVSVRNCQDCRITRCDFSMRGAEDSEKNHTWLTLYGGASAHNQVDHNRFSGKRGRGYYLFITGEGDYVSQGDLIRRNHFVDRTYGKDENEFEAIRIGESRIGNVGGKSHTTIRENLFERCQGEDEIVSFKVGGGKFLTNSVIDCHGSIVFRDGNDGVFAGNFVIKTYQERPFADFRAGGVRFYGSGHRVYNNYFQGLDGTSMKAPLAIMHGAPAGSGAQGVADGLPASDCQVVHNTWVRCAQLRLGHASKKRPLPPENCEFSGNIVCETNDSQLLNLFEADGISFSGNILYANRSKETGIESREFSEREFRVVDPLLKQSEGLYRLSTESPVVDAAQAKYEFLTHDIDQEARDLKPDVGADELGTSSVRKPLTPSEVGPTAK
ncbi:MAG: polysaccharide lyase 6 family protein [Lacipirellulaceae bacterium]